MKAGGPNYVAGLMSHPAVREAQRDDPDRQDSSLSDTMSALLHAAQRLVGQGRLSAQDLTTLAHGADAIDRAVKEEFSRCYDPLGLLGQDNLRRYLPVPHVRVRLQSGDHPVDVLLAAAAAVSVQCRAVFSHPASGCEASIDCLQEAMDAWGGRVERTEESDSQLAAAIRAGAVDRLRILSQEFSAAEVLQACAEQFVSAIRRPVSSDGYVEVLWFLREQSISHDYHRYGNLGTRAAEANA